MPILVNLTIKTSNNNQYRLVPDYALLLNKEQSQEKSFKLMFEGTYKDLLLCRPGLINKKINKMKDISK